MDKTYTYSISSMFVIGAILFWGVPILGGLLDENLTDSITRMFLEIIQPSFCAFSGFVYTRSTRFTWYLPIGIILLFLPVCFIYYTIDMLLWVPIYGGLNLAGCAVAMLLKRKK